MGADVGCSWVHCTAGSELQRQATNLDAVAAAAAAVAVSVAVQQDVGGLEVAVHKAVEVQVVQTAGHAQEDVQALRQSQGGAWGGGDEVGGDQWRDMRWG